MNLKQLQFALLVAQTGSFSRAAELAFATQPTLSNAISQLEEELGGRLFNRTTRKVEITPFGRTLLPYMQRVAQSRDDLLEAAEQYLNPTHKMLRIGFSPLVDMQRLNQAIQPFRQRHPDVHVYFKECFVDELSSRLHATQIDIQVVVARELAAEENSMAFYRDELRYLPAADESDQQAGPLPISELPTAPIILTGGGCGLNDAVERMFASERCKFSPYPGQALTYKVIEEWTSIGIGAGILPTSKLSADNTSARPLLLSNNEPAVFAYEWIWKRGKTLSDTMIEFLTHIEKAVPALVAGQARTGKAVQQGKSHSAASTKRRSSARAKN